MTQSMTHNALRPQPVVTAETRTFWDGAAHGDLRLRRCTGCGRLAAPGAPRCVGCLGDAFRDETLSGSVVLVGRTVLHLQPLPGRDGPLVIVECAVAEDPRIVLIALDESGVTENARPGSPFTVIFPATEEGACFATVQP
jgi:hypothetical protein